MIYLILQLDVIFLNGPNKVKLAEFFYHRGPTAQLIRSITWTKDGMAYSLIVLTNLGEIVVLNSAKKEHMGPAAKNTVYSRTIYLEYWKWETVLVEENRRK